MEPLPASIGRYDVKAFIARGGMGTLYLASDPVLQRQVAIKLLRDADNDELRTRFTREARSAASLRHHNIVTIFDVGEHEHRPFMAMEYIHGQTLRTLIQGDPPPSIIRRLQIVEDLCDGLAYAHKRGVIHRDVKPANLMIDGDGTLKILDFGIARAMAESGMTQAGLLVGTLNYMSPEQIAGTPLDGRSDMFAVGALLYELLTRRQAFPGPNDAAVLNKILNGEPEPLETLFPHLDPAIGRLVRRALAKEPANRFDDLSQMRSEVARARRDLEASALPDADETMALLHTQETTRVTATPTPTPSRRGTDLESIARRRVQQIEEHVLAAREALATSDFNSAIARCEEALLLDPNESRALDLAERARRQRDETAARDWLDQAQQHLRSGELTTAASCVREALALTPESPSAIEIRRLVGEARLAQERAQQRVTALQTLLDRGRNALASGEIDQALSDADEALALNDAHEPSQRLRQDALEARAERDTRQHDQDAREAADEARALFEEGQHADALARLEEFSPAHPVVSQAWRELSARAARLDTERGEAPPSLSQPADTMDATVFAPRPAVDEPRPPAASPLPPPVPAAHAGPADRTVAVSARDVRPVVVPPAVTATEARRSRGPVFATVAAVLLLLPAGAFILWPQGTRVDDTVAAVMSPADGPDAESIPIEPPAVPPVVTEPIDPDPPPPAVVAPPPPVAQPRPADTPPPPTTPPRAQTQVSPSTLPAPPPPRPSEPTPVVPVPPGASASVTGPPSVVLPSPALEPAPLPVRPPETTPVTPAPAVTPTPSPASPRAVASPPAAPPAPTPRPSPPPAPQVSDDALIRQTLAAYTRAFNQLDVDGVLTVFPTLSRPVVETGFRNAQSQEMRIEGLVIEVQGDRATARGRVAQTLVPRRGSGTSVNQATEFRLQKIGGTWVIIERRQL